MAPPTIVPGTLRLTCAGFSVPPMFIIADEKDPQAQQDRTGYESAVAREVAKRLGVKVEFVPTDWNAFRESIERKDAQSDAIICGQAITEERKAYLLYSRPYGAWDECFLVPSSSPITDLASIPAVSKALGRPVRIGAIDKSTNAALVELLAKRVGTEYLECVPFDGATSDVLGDMVAAADEGRTDGVCDDDIAFPKYLVPEAGGKYRIAHTEPTQQRWAFSFSKLRPAPQALVDAVDGALTAMIADGWFKAEWDRWFGAGNAEWVGMFGARPLPACISEP
ncbi:hypothetical protein DFJ74DRAFT_766346 [Hyaloraphidium curvatum]|nr:hypothetical protein DFJ74DRAFT_766346 [Hyaloraphidium curvatum]